MKDGKWQSQGNWEDEKMEQGDGVRAQPCPTLLLERMQYSLHRLMNYIEAFKFSYWCYAVQMCSCVHVQIMITVFPIYIRKSHDTYFKTVVTKTSGTSK